ncbi:hypothetical protein HanPSC8_Chr07g0300911 [Helianthus annuus]|nr:hypothetical protein HanPSC8_Chr07g0300911 [Helianthus annuus]
MAGMCCGETMSYRDSTPSTTEPSGGGRGRRRRYDSLKASPLLPQVQRRGKSVVLQQP